MISHKGIAHPSPHNIYYVGSGLSLGLRSDLCLASASKGVPSLVAVVYHGLPTAFVSPSTEYQQFLIGFTNHGSPVVGVVDSAGFSSVNGIIPTTNRTFISSVHDRPGGAGCYRLSCKRIKKATCTLSFPGEEESTTLQAAIVFALFRQPMMSRIVVHSPHPLPKISSSKGTTALHALPNRVHFR